MYQSLIDGSDPGTVPTKKYPGNRAYHKGSSGSAPEHGLEKPYAAKIKNGEEIQAQIGRDEYLYHGMEQYRLHEAV